MPSFSRRAICVPLDDQGNIICTPPLHITTKGAICKGRFAQSSCGSYMRRELYAALQSFMRLYSATRNKRFSKACCIVFVSLLNLIADFTVWKQCLRRSSTGLTSVWHGTYWQSVYLDHSELDTEIFSCKGMANDFTYMYSQATLENINQTLTVKVCSFPVRLANVLEKSIIFSQDNADNACLHPGQPGKRERKDRIRERTDETENILQAQQAIVLLMSKEVERLASTFRFTQQSITWRQPRLLSCRFVPVNKIDLSPRQWNKI